MSSTLLPYLYRVAVIISTKKSYKYCQTLLFLNSKFSSLIDIWLNVLYINFDCFISLSHSLYLCLIRFTFNTIQVMRRLFLKELRSSSEFQIILWQGNSLSATAHLSINIFTSFISFE
jgi:hypothetical protein